MLKRLALRGVPRAQFCLPLRKLLDKFLTEDMAVPLSPLEIVEYFHASHSEGPLSEIIGSLEFLPQRDYDFLHHLGGRMPVWQHGSYVPMKRLFLLRIKAEELVLLGVKRLRHIEGY
jgi:hypothetical protein